MNNHFEKAFQKLDECMDALGKGVGEMFEKKDGGGTLRLKKGARVYLQGGVWATLQADVDVTVSGKTEGDPEIPK